MGSPFLESTLSFLYSQYYLDVPLEHHIHFAGYIIVLIGVLIVMYLENMAPNKNKTQHILTTASIIVIGIIAMTTTIERTTSDEKIYSFSPHQLDYTYYFYFDFEFLIVSLITLFTTIAFTYVKSKATPEQYIKSDEIFQNIKSFLLIWILFMIILSIPYYYYGYYISPTGGIE